MKNWWQEDWSQEMVIFVLGIFGIFALVLALVDTTAIDKAIMLTSNIAAGFIGYLSKKNPTPPEIK